MYFLLLILPFTFLLGLLGLYTFRQPREAPYLNIPNDVVKYRLTKKRFLEYLETRGKPYAVVVGGGVSGLACAATLARIGKRVLVLDKGDQLGGGCHTFVKGGFEFETGLHYCGNRADFEPLLDFLTSEKIRFAGMGTIHRGRLVHDEICINGESFYACHSNRATFAQLKTQFPSHVRSIDAWVGHLKALASWHGKLGAVAFYVGNALPWPLRILTRPLAYTFTYYAYRTCDALLDECGVTSPSLRAALLGQYGDAGLPPSDCSAVVLMSAVNHYSNGACYPAGGPSSIVEQLATTVWTSGGACFTKANVNHVVLGQGEDIVLTLDKSRLAFRTERLVSSIGARASYKIFPEIFPRPCLPSTNCFAFLFVGLKTDAQLEQHNTWFYPSSNLNGTEQDLEEKSIFEIDALPMFVSSSSSKDPMWSARHPRKQTVTVISPCPFRHVVRWAHLSTAKRLRNKGYQKFKARLKQLMWEGFVRRFGKFVENVVMTEVGTPLTCKDYLSGYGAYGTATVPERFKRSVGPYVAPKIWRTGQDLLQPGFPAALYAGFLTANFMTRGTPLVRFTFSR